MKKFKIFTQFAMAVTIMSALLFVSCQTEEDILPQEQELLVQPTVTAKTISRDCPIDDYQCTDLNTSLIDLFGDQFSGYGTYGILDNLLNCDREAIELCNRACESVKIEIYGYGMPQISISSVNDSSDVFTAAEQLALVNTIKAQAELNAPICGARKMTPIFYDVLHGVSFSSGFINTSVFVTYIAHCNNYEL